MMEPTDETRRSGVEGWAKMDAARVAHDCSRRHVQSVLEDMQQDIAWLLERQQQLTAAAQVLIDNGGLGPEAMFEDMRDAITATATGKR